MSEVETVKVSILDKEYLVNCPSEARASLEQSARHLDHKMREIRSTGKVIGLERIAVMAALNISHEALSREQSKGVSQDQLQQLADRLDAALTKNHSLPFEDDSEDQGSL
ncbi:cell division protein ZapA [Litoribrevibacter euphylliae]|uniref:Cell division protein ZapA n=1 Tax=Litoribrevibacter euphylliae TaxID=1834034 RepID=A0ABV7HF31_9GAMM